MRRLTRDGQKPVRKGCERKDYGNRYQITEVMTTRVFDKDHKVLGERHHGSKHFRSMDVRCGPGGRRWILAGWAFFRWWSQWENDNTEHSSQCLTYLTGHMITWQVYSDSESMNKILFYRISLSVGSLTRWTSYYKANICSFACLHTCIWANYHMAALPALPAP